MRDLEKYTKATNFRIILGALILIFFVGDGLIFLLFGKEPAVMGLICLIVGFIPVILIVLVIGIINWIVNSSNKK